MRTSLRDLSAYISATLVTWLAENEFLQEKTLNCTDSQEADEALKLFRTIVNLEENDKT